jgi:hypothetical protein
MSIGKPAQLERLVRVSAILLAAAAFLTFVNVQTAVASCGDYVMVGGPQGAHGDGTHSMPGVPVCKGPNCQRSLPLPVVPTKGLFHRPHSDAACWTACQESPCPPHLSEVVESSLRLAEGYSLPLLRPPCL